MIRARIMKVMFIFLLKILQVGQMEEDFHLEIKSFVTFGTMWENACIKIANFYMKNLLLANTMEFAIEANACFPT